MLTASDVSAVIGTNFYTTPERLLNKKLGIEAPEKLNAALRHGNFYEAEARRLYEEKTGEKCVEFGLKPHDRYFTLPSRLEVP
jgi:predicted phage-related endonuclease